MRVSFLQAPDDDVSPSAEAEPLPAQIDAAFRYLVHCERVSSPAPDCPHGDAAILVEPEGRPLTALEEKVKSSALLRLYAYFQADIPAPIPAPSPQPPAPSA